MRHDDSFPVKARFDAAADIPLDTPVFSNGAGCSDLHQHAVILKGNDAHDFRRTVDPFDLPAGYFHFFLDHGDKIFRDPVIGAGNIDNRSFEASAHVGDCPDIAVGDYVNVAVPVPDGRGSDGHGFHRSVQVVDPDQVAHFQIAFAPEEKTGNNIFHQRLCAEGDRDTDYSDRGENRLNIKPEQIQDNGNDGKIHDITENAGGEEPGCPPAL